MAGKWDAQSHDQKIKIKSKIIANKTPPGLMLVGGTRCFGKPWIGDCWWRGSKKLYFSVWEPPIMYVVWKILRTLGRYVDNESIPLKKNSSLFLLRALAPLQIPASLCEGPIFYFYARVSSIPSHSNLLFIWQASYDGKI